MPKNTVVILHQMSADEEMREIARLREKAIRDEASAKDYYRRTALAEGKELGLAEGIAKGRAEEREKMTAKLREMGISEAQIQELLNN